MKKALKIVTFLLLLIVVVTAAIYGAAYFAVAKGWTNVEGEVDQSNDQYQQNYLEKIGAEKAVAGPEDRRTSLSKLNECKLGILEQAAPVNADKVAAENELGQDDIVSSMLLAASIRSKELSEAFVRCGEEGRLGNYQVNAISNQNIYPWANTEEWQIIIEAINKDKNLIDEAAGKADVDPRLLYTPLAVEQLRMYFSQREYYEKFFKPLKILVNTNQMAWGVMAIKEKSAEQIENNLKDANSAYYPGPKYEHLLDFSSNNPLNERATRLNNDTDHSWSYLYGALYLKEIMMQWQKGGYPIDGRPEVITTLYNLGFSRSKPKEKPEVGGSTLDIGPNKYTFGGLSYEIYYSGEMIDSFPYPLK